MAETSALLEAYLRKRADLVRFFTKRTGSSAAAEDLVQDLYLRITSGAAPGEVRSPEAFLYRVGSNLMLDRMKAERRQATREGLWTRARTGDAVEPAAEEASIEDELAARQRLARLVAAIDELPPQVARAFRRHRFDGLSQGQIAEELGVSRSSVEKYIMTALRHLMGRMDP